MMKNFHTLGLVEVQAELTVMQNPGFYWVTCNRSEDARDFIRQVLASQDAATLISTGEKPRELLTPDLPAGPDVIPLFSLPGNKSSLLSLGTDFTRSLNKNSGLVLFYNPASLWDKLTSAELTVWIKRMRRELIKMQRTLLIVSVGTSIINLRNNLQRYFRQVDGVAHLEFQQDSWKYRINWWYSTDRLLADRAIRLERIDNQFTAKSEQEQLVPLSLNDENQFLAEEVVLEGAPPLSKMWLLFNDHDALFSRAQQANAATVIFSLSHNENISALAKMLHSLRRSRGNGLKIVVREMHTSLRYSDERLLLACGVNAIIPSTATMSRFLTMLEGLQGQQFNRHVPENLTALIAALQPLQQKGFLPLHPFCDAVKQLMGNTLLPENDKGLLVALRPVPELKSEQVLALCKPRRFGDLVTVLEDRIYLFLSSCRFNDLDTALKFIFSLPHDELFANRIVWFEDAQVISEINKINNLTPGALGEKAQPAALQRQPASVTPEAAVTPRHIPQSLTLNIDEEPS